MRAEGSDLFCSFVRRLCGTVIGAMKGIKGCDWCGEEREKKKT